MDKYIVRGGKRLEGVVQIGGAKNSILPILAAVLLNRSSDEVFRPMYRAFVMLSKWWKFCAALVEITWSGADMAIKTDNLTGYVIDESLMREMRSTIFNGSHPGSLWSCLYSYPGGCAIGQRPIDLHLKGLAACTAAGTAWLYLCFLFTLVGADIHLDFQCRGNGKHYAGGCLCPWCYCDQ